jgi:guanylate kinase
VTDLDLIAFPIVVSGPSGVGKTTLCHGLIEGDSRLIFSISATTRPPRSMEEDGKDYFFISQEKFERMKADGEFAEWAFVHGQFYGTPRHWLDEQIGKGISVLLDIDVQGGVQIMEAYPECISIFVVPPSFEVLENRLRNRKSEGEDAVRQRLETAREEMEYVSKYAYIVVNDTVEKAVSKMRSFVVAERWKRERVLEGITWKEFVGLEGKGV